MVLAVGVRQGVVDLNDHGPVAGARGRGFVQVDETIRRGRVAAFRLVEEREDVGFNPGHRSLSAAFANLDLRGERRAHRFGEIVAGPRSAAVQIGAVSFLELRVLGRAAVADALRLAVRRLAIVAHGFIAFKASASSSPRSTGACDEPGSASPWPLLSRPRLQSAENARVNSVSA